MAMPEEKGLEEKDLETTEQPTEPEEKLFDVNNPDELPEPLKNTYNQWQKNYTQKRQQEVAQLKQMEQQMTELEKNNIILENNLNQWNQLSNDPSFLEWAQSKVTGTQPKEYESQIDFNKYEDADGIKTLLTEMRNMVRSEVTSALTPVMQTFATTKEQNEWVALTELSKQVKTVDPNTIRKEIDFVKRANPSLGLREAYEIAAFRNTLTTRPPVETNLDAIKKEIPTTGNVPITLRPAGSSYQEGRKSADEIIDDIIDGKKKSASKPVGISNILKNVLKERGVDERDLK